MKLNNAIKMAMIITTYSSIFPVTAWDYTMFLPQDQQQQDVIEEDQPTTTTPPIISIRAIDDIATCIASTTVEIDVLSNDIADPNAMPLTITETSNNGRNGACFNLNRYIRYLPVSGFTGTDECVYTVCDSLGGCDSATLTIIVTSSLDGSFATSPTNDNNAQNSPDSFTEYQPAIAIPETEIHDDDNDSRYNDDDDGGGQPLNSNDVALFLNNCPTGEVKITIELQTDQYGDDTTFELMKEENDDSTVVLSRGPYGFNSFDVVQICAPSPSIYTFIIYDKYGDGLCCQVGNGYFKIYLDDRELMNVDHFTHNSTQVINIGYDPKPSMTQRDTEYLRAHNKRRRTWHEMHNKTYVPLQWSQKLAEESLVWAYELLNECNSTDIEHEHGVLEGENLAKNVGNFAGWGQLYPPENIVRRWVDFEVGWLYPANAHLTQALWRGSKYMGCGESVKDYMGGKCRVQVCRYAKAGNCNMKAYNATFGENWLEPMLADTSPCEPSCPPEGCY